MMVMDMMMNMKYYDDDDDNDDDDDDDDDGCAMNHRIPPTRRPLPLKDATRDT